ncbi:MAG TPA: tRNA pseudouridine(13) synthase TruD [Steroidobacteraceae bacterium]|nr:tRNA pseudouridine(13) synthase TruD [Steroidobacteraceae bacterium]
MNPIEEMATLPCAHGGPAGRAQLRAAPEDFLVQEWLGWDADGAGDHLLLRVRKRGANTLWVAKQLARLAKVDPRDVGFAGLKDRDAVAEQAFTLPARSAIGDAWLGVSGDGFEVIAAARHRRKLKRGALKGNDFTIVLRAFTGDIAALEQRLRAISGAGVPNYFGPQRFGRDGSNLRTALAWFSGEAAPADRWQRGFALSAARAAIFNAVVAQRVRDGTWNRLLPGEVVNLDGTGSVFVADSVDATLEERCARLDVHPSGPMWGGPTSAAGAAAALEADVAARYDVLAHGLSVARLEPERRALRMRVDCLEWTIEADVVSLRFRLRRGAFATAVVHELIDNAWGQGSDGSDEVME